MFSLMMEYFGVGFPMPFGKAPFCSSWHFLRWIARRIRTDNLVV